MIHLIAKLVSDITDHDPQDATRAVTELVPAWTGSSTLDTLQELTDVAAQVPHEVARRAGLSTSELHSLRHLAMGSMGPVDLARALGVTSAASSQVIDRLVARGHAERRRHPADGRRTEVVITESGRREAVRHLAPMFEGLARTDASLTPAEREVVERYLRGAIAAMRSLT
ncbi:hypothetical protein PDTK01_21850 [Phycicoccus sp. DTK01]|nr:hypothetical protein PDTK01_21850 [Phycicoccus sp. DTK01]